LTEALGGRWSGEDQRPLSLLVRNMTTMIRKQILWNVRTTDDATGAAVLVNGPTFVDLAHHHFSQSLVEDQEFKEATHEETNLGQNHPAPQRDPVLGHIRAVHGEE